jgi:hypothetical protein
MTVSVWASALIISTPTAAASGVASPQTPSYAAPASSPGPSQKPAESKPRFAPNSVSSTHWLSNAYGPIRLRARRQKSPRFAGDGRKFALKLWVRVRTAATSSQRTAPLVRLAQCRPARSRAANALTAALAPIYPEVGDRVPAGVHRLDYLHRSTMLNLAAINWVRANTDSISARSTWLADRATLSNWAPKTKERAKRVRSMWCRTQSARVVSRAFH